MSNRETLLALAERCEAGQAADETALIVEAIGVVGDVERAELLAAGRVDDWHRRAFVLAAAIRWARDGAFLDAAASLLPDGAAYSVHYKPELGHSASITLARSCGIGLAATEPLARTAAALRAQAAMMEDNADA